jgi:hypothetical protein
MGGAGVELRMKLLRDAADQQLVKPFRTHGWTVTVSSESLSGEYLIVEATKSGATRRVALLYTSATDNRHYKELDAAVDHIFTNGALYHINSFAYGITRPVAPVGEFFPVLVAWNKELAPVLEKPLPPPGSRNLRIITADNPLTGIWSRLDQFASVTLAEKLVTRRATERSVELTPEAIKSKASGLAFTIRNASDYFRNTPFESLNKRILSLYYGALALASAEMMASPIGPTDLDEIEGITRQGHGLYTVPSATDDFGGLNVGVLATGFFPRWVSFLGYDISRFPKVKAKTASDLEKQPVGTVTTLSELLSAISELGDLFLEVFSVPPSWVTPVYNLEENTGGRGCGSSGQIGSMYIHLVDRSRRVPEGNLLTAGWPMTEVTLLSTDAESGNVFRARVDHAEREFWHEAFRLHHSPFQEGPTLIIPVLGGIGDHRVISLIVLYALSILVRYMPSSWRRVEGGNWDEHLALVKNAVGVFERLLPEQFLECIINERIHAKQPDGF